MLNIIKAYATKNLCYISAQKMVPKGIVVHSTGVNNPYLKRYVDAPDEVGVNRYQNHWNNPKPDGREVCVHAFIGYDKNGQISVAEILPLDICCWGVGKGAKGSYNYNPAYIQFEICEDNRKDKNYFEKAFAVAAEYCARLCQVYKISAEKIVGHCEAYRQGFGSNHSDPEHWMKNFGEDMSDFRNHVSEILKKGTDKEAKKIPLTENETVIQKGDLVSIDADATYYNGKAVPSWVKSQNWYVAAAPEGDRVVIDKNGAGTHSICSPINKKYLTVFKKTDVGLPDNEPTNQANQCPYRVKVTANSLNIRKSAGTNAQIVGAITDKGVYTIVEEQKGIGASKWGRLKSGAGWISLDFVRKI